MNIAFYTYHLPFVLKPTLDQPGATDFPKTPILNYFSVVLTRR